MKTKLFIYSIINRVISKTYGGSTYTFRVYEVVKSDIIFITEGQACTRGHKGEESEAFGQLIKARPDIKKMLIRNAKRALKKDINNYDAQSVLKDVENSGGYYFYNMRKFGLNLRSV
jgi:hypothetical protein